MSLVLSCSQTGDNLKTGFVLNGKLQNFENDTWLFLESGFNHQLDSVQLVNGDFQFTGTIPDSLASVQYILRTKDYSDYKFVWVENSEMTFEGTKGNFRSAKITGSETQETDDRLTAKIKPIHEAIDSIGRLINADSADESQKGEWITINHSNEKRLREETVAFVKDNSNSVVSAYVLSVYASTWGRSLTTDLYNGFTDRAKRTSYGREIYEFITLNKDIDIGNQVQEFKQADVNGKEIKLSDYKGKIVLLEFWASWCGPCRKENPDLVKVYKHYNDKGFEILGVALDKDKAQWLNAIDHDRLPWTNVCDLQGDRNEAAIIYGVSAIPANFLIDRNGVVIARNLRSEELAGTLDKIL
jgi:thiol-disulfide isomerase/thioredoxin